MAKMNRVERAAIQSKPLHGGTLNLPRPFGDGNPARQELKWWTWKSTAEHNDL
jgi:hypothetical protein